MKKHDEEEQNWFNNLMKEDLTRFDAAHAPEVPEQHRFEELVLAHVQDTKRKLWRELLLFWLLACLIFGVMLWIIDRNWIWFAMIQAVITAGGIGYASYAFARGRLREWKS
ncbi:DUF5345 family protein [Paenibacillus sp. 2TAB23]|uniref:DUF5345 family protein n=1 Tax=Paenibacillus sp. 2TAB23 TaxID=3233004 RepID=UPI003F98B6C6